MKQRLTDRTFADKVRGHAEYVSCIARSVRTIAAE